MIGETNVTELLRYETNNNICKCKTMQIHTAAITFSFLLSAVPSTLFCFAPFPCGSENKRCIMIGQLTSRSGCDMSAITTYAITTYAITIYAKTNQCKCTPLRLPSNNADAHRCAYLLLVAGLLLLLLFLLLVCCMRAH